MSFGTLCYVLSSFLNYCGDVVIQPLADNVFFTDIYKRVHTLYMFNYLTLLQENLVRIEVWVIWRLCKPRQLFANLCQHR